MKTKLTLICVLIIGLTMAGYSAFAADKAQTRAGEARVTTISTVQVQGVMQESKAGLSLVSGDSTYQLKGCEKLNGMKNETLKSMVGKLVQVSGDLEKDTARMAINVKTLEVIN